MTTNFHVDEYVLILKWICFGPNQTNYLSLFANFNRWEFHFGWKFDNFSKIGFYAIGFFPFLSKRSEKSLWPTAAKKKKNRRFEVNKVEYWKLARLNFVPRNLIRNKEKGMNENIKHTQNKTNHWKNPVKCACAIGDCSFFHRHIHRLYIHWISTLAYQGRQS